ncbi:hypothetical protein G6F62_003542 [Rhizopus arrhizus]|nr:hypothetical protein G6F62_003542 [Rhizopus arrhizus]
MISRNILGITIAAFITSTLAAYSSNGVNVMHYWGQNSAGGSNTQGSLASYCQSGQVDVVILSFLNKFNMGGLPEINLASACEQTFFPNTNLLHCPTVGSDIKTCQNSGVKVLLSLGGAAGSYGFSSDSEGQTFAETIWNLFGGGTSDTRPFDDAVIDGIDLDIEGGLSTGYAAFVTALRSKGQFLIGAAPQCPFPDAILGSVINAVGLDFINVQFYNNFCSVASGSSFNFDVWDDWAKNKSPNKNIKVMLTVPGSSTAAGSGYASIAELGSIISSVTSQYSSFGGVSVWDASQAWNNNGFHSELYNLVHGSSVALGEAARKTQSSNISSITTTSLATASSALLPLPYAGQSCSSQSKASCTSTGSYTICNYGKWVSAPCPPGVICLSSTQPNNTDPTVSAQFFITSFAGGSFKAVINARRTTLAPFEKMEAIEFTVPDHVRLSQCNLGKVEQVGRHVRIRLKDHQNMAFVLNLSGNVSSDVFVAPDPASWRFS